MTRDDVGACLLAYGRELEAQRAAQVGGSFTGLEQADALIESDPDAFLLGVLFTQGIPAERAWLGPFELKQRLGTLDLEYLATHPHQVRQAVQTHPMLHRFKETIPRWIVAAAGRILEDFRGSAANIWPQGEEVGVVTRRLAEFDGIGRKKAAMAVEILTRHFGVELAGREYGQVAYDVHVRRVFLRSGLVDEDSPQAVDAAAAASCPDAPGTLDLPAWLIGRDYCRPRSPRCDDCRLASHCAQRTWMDPEGVGVRRKGRKG